MVAPTIDGDGAKPKKAIRKRVDKRADRRKVLMVPPPPVMNMEPPKMTPAPIMEENGTMDHTRSADESASQLRKVLFASTDDPAGHKRESEKLGK